MVAPLRAQHISCDHIPVNFPEAIPQVRRRDRHEAQAPLRSRDVRVWIAAAVADMIMFHALEQALQFFQ